MAKILIIDDNAMMLKLYSEILKGEGYEVLATSEAKIAFDLAISQVPDLILLDIMMPNIDGTRIYESLSQNPKTKGIKMVFLTSLVKEEEVASGGGVIGKHGYISKSTPKEEFIKRVKQILSGK
jgi:CheY-like chemotaxis protein